MKTIRESTLGIGAWIGDGSDRNGSGRVVFNVVLTTLGIGVEWVVRYLPGDGFSVFLLAAKGILVIHVQCPLSKEERQGKVEE